MKKFLLISAACLLVIILAGCATTGKAPDYSKIPQEQGAVMPAAIFGEPGDKHDSTRLIFDAPKPIAVDSEGNIYAAGKAFDLTKFSADGKYLYIVGEKGEGKGQWSYPKGLAVNKNDDLIVSDANNLKIMIFDKTGKFIKEFGEEGSGESQFGDLGPVAVDAKGNIYVSDEGDITGIKKFTAEGKFVKVIVPLADEETPGTKSIAYVAVDDELGRLYVTDDEDGDIDAYDLESGKLLMSFSGHGLVPGKFQEDNDGVCVGPWNLVFVVDTQGGKIKVFNHDGSFITEIGKPGFTPGAMFGAEGLAYDPLNKRVVIADEQNVRIQSFALADFGF